ncbi:hypothetical protein GCM10027360_45260 [Amycolatopsis echigonensis]
MEFGDQRGHRGGDAHVFKSHQRDHKQQADGDKAMFATPEDAFSRLCFDGLAHDRELAISSAMEVKPPSGLSG